MGFRVFTTSVCDLIAIGLGTFSVLRKQTLYLPGGEAESPMPLRPGRGDLDPTCWLPLSSRSEPFSRR